MRNKRRLFPTVEYDAWTVLLSLHLQQVAVYKVARVVGVERGPVLVYDFLSAAEHEKKGVSSAAAEDAHSLDSILGQSVGELSSVYTVDKETKKFVDKCVFRFSYNCINLFYLTERGRPSNNRI